MPRLLPASLGFLAAGLIVFSALLPEFSVGGVDLAQVDPDRSGWVPALVGMLVEVGLILSAALMLILGESRKVAGGILVGAGVLGLTLRIVRLFQLAEDPGFSAGDGSWVDALAGVLTVTAGALALRGTEDDDLDEKHEEDLEAERAPAPLPGESPPRGD